LYKESRVHVLADTEEVVDTGYQGLQKLHKKTKIPKKRSKKNPLSKEDKKSNKEISSSRIVAEHVLSRLKRFKIISTRYRNRRSRFGLRMNLLAAIHNLEFSKC
jgi:transposase